MWGYIYGDKYGLVGQIFHMMGVQAPNMLSEQLMLFAIANICTWCFLGYNMLIYYSALIGIPNDLSELVADLAAENQNIIGIKDTVDTISHTRKVIAARSARHGCAGTCSTSICSTRMHRTCPAFGRSCGTGTILHGFPIGDGTWTGPVPCNITGELFLGEWRTGIRCTVRSPQRLH